ncbi:hypothetical protein FSP39_004316 [Pinctada imbricata]|uniref:G-protein coupled receptors family 1 profile domain-containing protein n=1 Tax=Pinctada imbricata TaxID=66713 RepID=A0AA88XN14_PINIB|nr:hypothetical protein FSP39_004316 [Pinctada imbricata]
MSTDNTTDVESFSDVSIISDRYKSTVVTLGGVNSFLAIIVNLVVVFVVLSDRSLRRSIFMWNVVSLGVSGLLAGLFIIPLNTSRFDQERWVHGATVCKALIVLDHVQLTLPAIILVFTNLNRIFKIRREHNPLAYAGFSQINVLQCILLISPWIYTFGICVPVLMVSKADDGLFESLYRKYCFFVMRWYFLLVMLTMMMILPIFLLLCSTSILALYYHYGSRGWNRLPNSENANPNSSDVVGTLRSTVFATMISSFVFLFCWTPDLFVLTKALSCHSHDCMQAESTYLTTYTVSCSACFLSQIPWFLITDVHLRVQELAHSVISRIRHFLDTVRRCCCSKPADLNVGTSDGLLIEGSDLI